MRGKFIHRAALGATAAAAVALTLAAGPAQAALQGRDLTGDKVVDAFYDTDLDITWLRDANVNGAMEWDAAVAWADGYAIGGYGDWRLPTSDTCSGYGCSSSEMGRLWYVELGNPAGGPMSNTGNFQDLNSLNYWSGTQYMPNTLNAWLFSTTDGNQFAYGKNTLLYAMAVHPGDVGAVPEPETYVLLMLGLAAMAVMRRRPR